MPARLPGWWLMKRSLRVAQEVMRGFNGQAIKIFDQLRMLNVTSSCTPARSTVSYCPFSIEIMRLPSHDMPEGLPPKLHGHDTVQLQLSATVAVRCQFGACAREGTTRTSRLRAVMKDRMRMLAYLRYLRIDL